MEVEGRESLTGQPTRGARDGPKDRPDPDDYTPEPDSVTAAEEYEPEPSADDPTREANPADVAEQLAALPTEDELDSDPTDAEPEDE